MDPNNRSQSGDAVGPSGSQPPQQTSSQDRQTAAANVLRTQIDALYGTRQVVTTTEERNASIVPSRDTAAAATNNAATAPVDDNPYQRTHSANPQPQAEQWKAYHTAWQDYYQKYYAAYYAQQKAIADQTELAKKNSPEPYHGTSQENAAFLASQNATGAQAKTDISQDEALYELRQKLLGKVRGQAKKIRKSKHFVPIAVALGIALIFVFVQYNRVFIATVNAYVSPGAIDPQNIVIDPTADTAVSADPRLVIPKINVDVPALYDVGSDYNSQMAAMEHGVAHFAIPGANSHPGEVGNTVLSGHSSNDLFDPGDYKFIFAQLEKLAVGDTIYANYNSKRYTYVVTKTEVVPPTSVGSLVYPTTKPILTLITCTPLGTSLNRLLVTAEQVSPDPAQATAAPAEASPDATSIPGSTPTFLERLFGANQ